MIAVEVSYSCDATGCGVMFVVLADDIIAGSDREQLVRVPSDLPAGWTLDNQGNLYCGSHAPPR